MKSENRTSEAEEPSKHSNAMASDERKKREVNWPMVLVYIHMNIPGVYGVYSVFSGASLATTIFTLVLTIFGVLGATVGAHRLWAHRTYTATAPLRLFLMLGQTLTGQGSIYDWVRAHRLHHAKFRQDEDPYYSNKSFFDAQIRAQFMSYSQEQEDLLAQIDMSDIEDDKIVMFQKRFYWALFFVLNALLPVNAPFEYWGESMTASIVITFSLRYLITSNVVYLISSAHFVWNLDENFKPSDSNSIFFITKTYWPQYHYLLPNDYLSGEFGTYNSGILTAMIRVFAALDLAKDLRTVSSVAVRNGLTAAVHSGRPYVECIEQEAKIEMAKMPANHFLNREKFM